ncbi:MAG: LBF_2804 family protein [Archangium sp.]
MTTPPVEKPPFMARVGRSYFASRSTKVRALTSGDAIHVLNPEERRRLRRVEMGAIFRASFSGAISGGLCATAEVFAEAHFSGDFVKYWGLVAIVTVIASVGEIAFIYWDTLRSVHELARVAGIELFGRDRQASDEALIDGLARAALELPNPVDIGIGVNPHREAQKWRLVLASLAYKAKVGVTNFLTKLLIRRLLSRVALRSYLPFVALPVTAFWNGVVTWKVMREARIRALGPSAIEELVNVVFTDAHLISAQAKLSAMRAVASSIVRTQDLHPNLVRLLSSVSSRAGDTGKNELDDVGLFLANLKLLDPNELRVSLQILAVACIVDGKLTAREKTLWTDAMAAAGKSVEFSRLEKLRAAFVRGDGIADDVIRTF